jgi:P-type E1-E2 ATPase
MVEINVPGRGVVKLNHLVCDVNGTLALDGKLLDGVVHKIRMLRDRFQIHLVTANTHGLQAQIDHQLDLMAHLLESGNESQQKAEFVRQLGAGQVVAVGQGANDCLMLREAAIGICVLSQEGAAPETLAAADIVVPDILAAFELLEKPLRLVATLRK